MMRTRWLVGLSVAVLAIGCLAGCGEKGKKQYPVAGKITFQGKPAPAGEIYFDPDLVAGNDGPQGFATIDNGEFDTRKGHGRGPTSGKYLMRITVFDGVPGPEMPLGKRLYSEDLHPIEIPEKESMVDLALPLPKKK